eukprot:Selendium_serpulae@DN6108_c3_g1_i4.p1
MTAKAPSNPSPFSAELQSFVVSKFDPLLSIVKELNDRLQASDKDRFRLEQRVSRLEQQLAELSKAAEAGRPLTADMLLPHPAQDLKPRPFGKEWPDRRASGRAATGVGVTLNLVIPVQVVKMIL